MGTSGRLYRRDITTGTSSRFVLRTVRDILCNVFLPFKYVLSSTSPLTVLFAFSLRGSLKESIFLLYFTDARYWYWVN